MKDLAILILAAGGASRMGSIKQLLPYKESTLLQSVINNAISSKANRVFCVLGANSEIIKNQLKPEGIIFIENPNWQKGLSSSIVHGVNYIQSLGGHFSSILILLADQPNVNPGYINKLVALYENNKDKIIASKYSDVNGVPAIFPFSYFKHLMNLHGDQGAKSLLNDSSLDIITMDLKSSNILVDIDTPLDYKELISKK